MVATTAIGIGILVAGVVFIATAGDRVEAGPRDALIKILTRTLSHMAVGVGLALLVTSLDGSASRRVTLIVGLVGVAWAIVKALKSQTAVRRLVLLGLAFVGSSVFALVSGAIFPGGGSASVLAASASSISDAEGDCECDPAFDLVSVGVTESGGILVETAGHIPDGAAYWIWTADSPLLPIEVSRSDGSWLVKTDADTGTDPSQVVLAGEEGRFELRVDGPTEAVAVTSVAGDRVPDGGFTGHPETSDLHERYQRAYGDLTEGARHLARAFVNAVQSSGSLGYAVGITADPGVVHPATLLSSGTTIEFSVPASATRGSHLDRFGDGGPVCRDDGSEECVAMWLDPYRGLDDLLSGTPIGVAPITGRVVLQREAACVAVTDPGATSLHEGEFCLFDDGTVAFVDDRTAGIVALLTEAPDA